MGKNTLVSEQITAGEGLIREFDKQFPVQAAFWLLEPDADDWYLYLASDKIDDTNFALAYREVLRINPPLKNIWLDPFLIKVVSASSPIAQSALRVMKDYAPNLPARYRGRELGGRSVDEAYIYSIPLAVGI